MNLEELEEELDAILDSSFRIEVDSNGQVVIFTGLCQDDDGELVECDIDFDEDDEEDEDFDPDFEPLDEEDDDD